MLNTLKVGIRKTLGMRDHLCMFCYLKPSGALEDTNSPFHLLSQSGNQTGSEERCSPVLLESK